MIDFEHLLNELARKKTTLCYRHKCYRMTIFFVIWLAYSACVLGWSIKNTSSGQHCTNNIN